MQVILTEEEYLKLKHQHEEQKKAYLKRIDVEIALKDMLEDLWKSSGGGDRRPQWDFASGFTVNKMQEVLNQFWKKVDNE